MRRPEGNSSICCFVVHSLHPYLHDVTQLLALPQGFRYRLRYDGTWVESGLRRSIEELEGLQALALFYDDATKNLFPIRWASVEVARQVGRIFYFELTLQELPSYESDPEARKAQVSGFNRTFDGFHHGLFVERDDHAVLELCVFLSGIGQHIGKTEFDDLTKWGNVVDGVSEAAAFVRVEFLKIMDLTDRSGNVVRPQQEAYALRDGETYTLRVFQIIPNAGGSRGEPHDIELRASSDGVQIHRRRQRAVGKYDVLTYAFKLSGLFAGERSALELAAIPAGSEITVMTGLDLPILAAAPSLPLRIARFGALLASLVLVFLPLMRGMGTWEVALSYIGTLAFVVSIVGWRSLLKVLWPFKSKL